MKPSIPKGTRDFGPVEMAKRNYIFNTIRSVYELYGFQQIETPAQETLQTLMGKYGEEGDKLLFRIQNSGAKASEPAEKGLRYDLTVPFARYVVMHREELQMPFKRYQVQPVWRADRPQKGRYREFYQFDGDVVGSDSLLNEVELMQIVDEVFRRLGIRVEIKINNRKILTGIAEVIGAADKIVDITVAIDKLDKIGIDNVNAELREDGLTEEQIQKLQPIILLQGTNDEKLATIATILKDSEVGLKGVDEVKFILSTLHSSFLIPHSSFSLTGIFGLPGLSGVGISFGVDRIYDVLNTLDLYPKDSLTTTQVLFINFGEQETAYCLPIINKVRSCGIRAEIFPDAAKMKKQMSYANAKQIPFVVLAGENEMNAGKVTLKNMETGEQSLLSEDELIERLKN